MFIPISNFLTVRTLKYSSDDLALNSLCLKLGKSPVGSFVKTLLKKSYNTSALSSSLSAIKVELSLLVCSSDIPDDVFRLEFTYFQKFLGFDFEVCAISFSLSRFSFLTSHFTLFLAFAYSSYEFSFRDSINPVHALCLRLIASTVFLHNGTVPFRGNGLDLVINFSLAEIIRSVTFYNIMFTSLLPNTSFQSIFNSCLIDS